MRSYAVLGTGAISSYYGARLAAAGHRVVFLARSDAAALRAGGLSVTSTDGDVRIAAAALLIVTDPTDLGDGAGGPVDVVLNGVKAGDPNPAAALLHHVPMGPRTIVVNLQNGLDMEADLVGAVGRRALLGGLCFICVNRLGGGVVEHVCGGSMTVAAHGGNPASAPPQPVLDVVDDLRAAGVPATAEVDLVLARWKKLVWNVPFNPLAVILGAEPRELLADPVSRELVIAAMHDVRAAAAAAGRDISPAFVDRMVAGTEGFPPYRTSMGLDYESGRPLEVDAILGRPLRVAQAAGVAVPTLELLWRMASYLDPGRSR